MSTPAGRLSATNVRIAMLEDRERLAEGVSTQEASFFLGEIAAAQRALERAEAEGKKREKRDDPKKKA